MEKLWIQAILDQSYVYNKEDVLNEYARNFMSWIILSSVTQLPYGPPHLSSVSINPAQELAKPNSANTIRCEGVVNI